MDVDALVKHAVSALVAGGGSFYASWKSLRARISKLEKEAVLEQNIEKWKQTVIQGVRLEWEMLKLEIDKKINSLDRASSPTSYVEYDRRIKALEDELRDKRFVTDVAFDDFLQENTKSWNEINRLIGELVGEIRARRRGD